MKTILLTTTALVAFAGAAAADGHTSVSFSGAASAEYNSLGGFNTDADLDATMSAELDNGLTVSTTLSFDTANYGSIADGTVAGSLTLSSDTASLTFGNDITSASFSAVGDTIAFGDGEDVTFTHDGSTGMDVAAAGAFDVTAGAQSVIKTSAAGLMLSGATNVGIAAAAGPVFLDGSQSVGIQTDGTFAFSAIAALAGTNAEALLFETPSSSEASTYISNFSTSTSVLGAINSLFSSVTSGEPTLFSGSIASTTSAGAAVTLTKLAGDVSSFGTSIAPNKLDVYVNGQLMKSGSETDRAAGNVDYAVSGTNELKFSFALVYEDLVSAIDRS